jgi:hypothetical protein
MFQKTLNDLSAWRILRFDLAWKLAWTVSSGEEAMFLSFFAPAIVIILESSIQGLARVPQCI